MMRVLYSKKPLCNIGGKLCNQDAYQVNIFGQPSQPVYQFLVADGLGGQGGGELASWTALRKMKLSQFDTEALREKFELAHTHLKTLQKEGKRELSRMATTMVSLTIKGNQAFWGHAGDSRLYLFRDGKVRQQTRDHSVPQMLLSSGDITPEEIRNHPDRNRVLRALGDKREELKPRIHKPVNLLPGDAFLLCTDGFWEYVHEMEMLNSLTKATTPDHWLTLMETEYMLPAVERETKAKARGKSDNDNYTALAVWYSDNNTFSVSPELTI